jgi:hypothetical protein
VEPLASAKNFTTLDVRNCKTEPKMVPGSRGLFLMRWIIASFVILPIFMLMRFWAARLVKRRFYADDAFSIIAFVSFARNTSVAAFVLSMHI